MTRCTARGEADIVFGVSHRACVGKNLANLELQMFMATIFRRYTFILENPEKRVSRHLTLLILSQLIEFFFFLCAQFDTVEGFLRKPISCRVGMKRRPV